MPTAVECDKWQSLSFLMAHVYCTGEGRGKGRENNGFQNYALYCTHYTGTGAGTETSRFYCAHPGSCRCPGSAVCSVYEPLTIKMDITLKGICLGKCMIETWSWIYVMANILCTGLGPWQGQASGLERCVQKQLIPNPIPCPCPHVMCTVNAYYRYPSFLVSVPVHVPVLISCSVTDSSRDDSEKYDAEIALTVFELHTRVLLNLLGLTMSPLDMRQFLVLFSWETAWFIVCFYQYL